MSTGLRSQSSGEKAVGKKKSVMIQYTDACGGKINNNNFKNYL